MIRRLVVSAAGATIALVALAAVGEVAPAAANNGDGVIAGVVGNAACDPATTSCTNRATATTGVYTSGGNGLQGQTNDGGASGVYGQNDGSGYGVAGSSGGGTGVFGVTGGGPGYFGVWGKGFAGFSFGGTGVWGEGGLQGTGLLATGHVGVQAKAEDDGSHTSTAIIALGGGTTAIDAQADPGGTALKVQGKVTFSRSGRATVLAGASSVTIQNVALEAKSSVLATLQQKRGSTAVAAAVPSPGTSSITIYLTQAVAKDTRVSWFVIG